MKAASEVPSRNLALELIRVTEAAAISAAREQGRGDKELVDQAAVDAMRQVLGRTDLDGIVVIGEGEKDEAPMLFNGERVGNGNMPEVDVAVDPVDGTRLTAEGRGGALAVIALAERVVSRVVALCIHHPRSEVTRYLSISAGVAFAAAANTTFEDVLSEARRRAGVAREQGGNRVSFPD